MKKLIVLLTLCFCFSLSAENTLLKNKWYFLFSGISQTSVGNNTYGTAVNNDLLVGQAPSTFAYQVVAGRTRGNEVWVIGYTDFSPTWKSNTVSSSDYSGAVQYTGKDSLKSFTFQHGYILHFPPALSITLHAGFSYLQQKSVADNLGNYQGSSSVFKHGESEFSGFGPTVGFILGRQLSKHWSFSNSADIGLAYGDIKASSYSVTSTGAQTNSAQTPAHKVLLPYLNMSLALGYNLQLSKSAEFKTKLGMQFKQLFDAANTHDASSSRYDNVAYYGPFLSVSYLF